MNAKHLAPLAFAAAAAIGLNGCGGGGGGSPAAATPLPNEVVVATDQSTLRFYAVTDSGVTERLSVALPGVPGSYTRSGNTVTVTMSNHGIRDGLWATLDFLSGSGGIATDGTYRVTVVNDDTFTLTDTASGAISAGQLLRKPESAQAATYAQAGLTVAVTLANHGLLDNDNVELDFTSGTSVDLATRVDEVLDANTFTVFMPTSAGTSGNVTVKVGSNYTVNDVRLHPSGKWLYVASGYDCVNGVPYCWGGETLTRFAINWATSAVTPADIVRLGTDPYDIPVRMDINASGDRLVVKNDNGNDMHLFGIAPLSGALTQLARSDAGQGQTVVFSPDGQYVYDGNNVYTVTTGPDAIANSATNAGAADGLIAGGTLFTLEASSSVLSAYRLATPATPTLITTLTPIAPILRTGITPNRALTANSTGSLLVVAGSRGLKSYTFNGTTLAAATPGAGSAELQADGTASLSADPASLRMYTSVNMDSTGSLLAAAYLTLGFADATTPSGFVFARVGADGALTRIANLPGAKYAHTVRFIKKP